MRNQKEGEGLKVVKIRIISTDVDLISQGQVLHCDLFFSATCRACDSRAQLQVGVAGRLDGDVHIICVKSNKRCVSSPLLLLLLVVGG